MAQLLHDHAQHKAKKVNGWDLISAGLGLGATLLIGVSIMQPRNPTNVLRLPVAVALFAASVGAERARESDLLSLDRAVEFQNNLKSDRIRFDTTISETLYQVEQAEKVYQLLPIDRHEEVATRLGIKPPNYEARKVDPVAANLQTPEAATQTMQPDPTGDFDPEERSGMTFIPANQVASWFQELGDSVPQSLIDEWSAAPGKGIQVIDGSAKIIGGSHEA